jgi:hypothetical protein
MKIALARRIKMDYLFKSMYAGIRSACTLDCHWMIRDFGQGLFKYLLNTALVGLPLPARKAATIIFNA